MFLMFLLLWASFELLPPFTFGAERSNAYNICTFVKSTFQASVMGGKCSGSMAIISLISQAASKGISSSIILGKLDLGASVLQDSTKETFFSMDKIQDQQLRFYLTLLGFINFSLAPKKFAWLYWLENSIGLSPSYKLEESKYFCLACLATYATGSILGHF